MDNNINDSEQGTLEQKFEYLSLTEYKDYWDQNSIRSIKQCINHTLSSTLSSYSMSATDSEDPLALDGAGNGQTPLFDLNRLKHRISEIAPKINDVCDNKGCIQEKVKHLEGAVGVVYAKEATHREKCEEHYNELYQNGANEKQTVINTNCLSLTLNL